MKIGICICRCGGTGPGLQAEMKKLEMKMKTIIRREEIERAMYVMRSMREEKPTKWLMKLSNEANLICGCERPGRRGCDRGPVACISILSSERPCYLCLRLMVLSHCLSVC